MVNIPRLLDMTLELLLLFPQSMEIQNFLWKFYKFSRKLAFHSQSIPDLWGSAFLYLFLLYTIESQCTLQLYLQFPGQGDGALNRIENTMCFQYSVQLYVQFSSVIQLCPTLQPHGIQHSRPPCPPPTPGVYSNSCPLSQ